MQGQIQGQLPGQMQGQLPGQAPAQIARPPFQTYTGNMMTQGQPRRSLVCLFITIFYHFNAVTCIYKQGRTTFI